MLQKDRESVEKLHLAARERWVEFEDAIFEGLAKLRPYFQLGVDFLDRWPVVAQWLLVGGSLALATLLGLVMKTFMTTPVQLLLFLPAVAVSTLAGGLLSGLIASVLGSLIATQLYAGVVPGRGYQTDIVAVAFYFVSSAIIFALGHAQDKRKRQVQALTQSLEDRVVHRTAELQKANDELAEFCYSISHDLRAPMRNMVGSSRIIVDEAGERLQGEHKERLESIAASANRLSELVDDLLEYARVGHRGLKLEWIDVSSMAEEIFRQLQSQRWPCTSAEARFQPNLIVPADRLLVRTVIQNLIENAFKYSKPGSKLTLEIGERLTGGKRACFVRDNGIGFDMQYVEKIFQPFQRLHRDVDYEGTGIGLANTKRIIERHGGEIWAESKPGEGTTFFFTLKPEGMGLRSTPS